jgi:hypothetical protein
MEIMWAPCSRCISKQNTLFFIAHNKPMRITSMGTISSSAAVWWVFAGLHLSLQDGRPPKY